MKKRQIRAKKKKKQTRKPTTTTKKEEKGKPAVGSGWLGFGWDVLSWVRLG